MEWFLQANPIAALEIRLAELLNFVFESVFSSLFDFFSDAFYNSNCSNLNRCQRSWRYLFACLFACLFLNSEQLGTALLFSYKSRASILIVLLNDLLLNICVVCRAFLVLIFLKVLTLIVFLLAESDIAALASTLKFVEGICEDWYEMYANKYSDQGHETEADKVARLWVWHVVTEAHENVQNEYCHDFVECLEVIRPSRIKRLCPLNQDYERLGS